MRNPLSSRGHKKHTGMLEPDEIFIDAKNLPSFDRAHMEGRIERPLSPNAFRGLLLLTALLVLVYIGQTVNLTVFQHDSLSSWAEQNRLVHKTIIAERGLIEDRNGVPLAQNSSTTTGNVTDIKRSYPLGEAAAQLVGYVSYPKRDSNGYWYQDQTMGITGIEELMDERLKGKNGIEIAETNAAGSVMSGSIVRKPESGETITLSIDADLQKAVYNYVKERADASFIGGAAAIMDITNGELLALVSYPSFDPEVMSSGEPKEKVQQYTKDTRSPFVDRAVVGLYTPGSIVKPFVAAAALNEKVVTPNTTFVSTGKLVVPNPYDASKPSVFKDWKAHGAVDMRRAIAVSSDVYFYIVGGGFESQKGLGITALDTYAKKFGFGSKTGFPDDNEPEGTIPTPEWKALTFDDPVWRVGDTYITSIGQFGWQVTLLQAVRAVASLANGGVLHTPTVQKGVVGSSTTVDIPEEYLKVAREGMRQAVSEGTAQSLSIPEFRVAGKTGTAETGAKKEFTNSLVIGFFPYEKPRYAFAVIMERSHAGTALGAPAVMHNVLQWIAKERPEMGQPTE